MLKCQLTCTETDLKESKGEQLDGGGGGGFYLIF